MTTLMQAHRQWISRAPDERFTSLIDMQAFRRRIRDNSRTQVINSSGLSFRPVEDDPRALQVIGYGNGLPAAAPTHWSAIEPACPDHCRLPQLQSAFYPRRRRRRHPLHRGRPRPRTACSQWPQLWTRLGADIVDLLVDRFGDGITGQWRVPGEFGQRVTITKDNTTLFASDRDMFVFLADEENRIELPGRRAGRSGSFARGFFVWNSEVGKTTLGASFFLFDYVCCNRIIWGANQYTEVRIRHTKGAPDRWLDEVTPVLREYSQASAKPVVQAIEDARNKHVDANLDQFLANRFGKRMVTPIKAIHETEEGRPIETLWDVTVAATAHARSIRNTDARLDIERTAGELLKRAA